MKQLLNSGPAVYGTVGGTFTGFLVNLNSGDLLRTSVLAAVGAVVSFSLSLVFHLLIQKWRKRG
jgi:hypothetical protein